MVSLSDDKQAYIIDAFNTTPIYMDDVLNIYNISFVNMVSQIYPAELQLNKAYTSDTEASFLDLYLFISNAKNYVPLSTSYGTYIYLLQHLVIC